jgi:hypothetical protein
MINRRQAPGLHNYVNALDPEFVPSFPYFLRVAAEHHREIDDVNVFRTVSVRVIW